MEKIKRESPSTLDVFYSNVGQEARGSHDREMIFNILCNFRYFSSSDFISLILGVFMTFLVKSESSYGIVSIRICFGIFLLGK